MWRTGSAEGANLRASTGKCMDGHTPPPFSSEHETGAAVSEAQALGLASRHERQRVYKCAPAA